MADNERVVRVPLAAAQIRRMDELILQGAGGFLTRTEFIREAIESQIVELAYPLAGELASVEDASAGNRAPAAEVVSELGPQGERRSTPEGAVLLAIQRGVAVEPTDTQVVDEALFGLHNRDFPSLWALRLLAQQASDGPVSWTEFARYATDRAWEFGRALQASYPAKLSALFPTNPAKYQQASSAFREFALGRVETSGPRRVGRGPLFAWHVATVVGDESAPLVGVTSEGWTLLESLEALSIEQPHSRHHAEAFLEHLERWAPCDFGALRAVAAAAAEQLDRGQLVAAVARLMPGWKQSVVATNATGYVARAREWGLLEGGLVGGCYAATTFGTEFLLKGERYA